MKPCAILHQVQTTTHPSPSARQLQLLLKGLAEAELRQIFCGCRRLRGSFCFQGRAFTPELGPITHHSRECYRSGEQDFRAVRTTTDPRLLQEVLRGPAFVARNQVVTTGAPSLPENAVHMLFDGRLCHVSPDRQHLCWRNHALPVKLLPCSWLTRHIRPSGWGFSFEPKLVSVSSSFQAQCRCLTAEAVGRRAPLRASAASRAHSSVEGRDTR